MPKLRGREERCPGPPRLEYSPGWNTRDKHFIVIANILKRFFVHEMTSERRQKTLSELSHGGHSCVETCHLSCRAMSSGDVLFRAGRGCAWNVIPIDSQLNAILSHSCSSQSHFHLRLHRSLSLFIGFVWFSELATIISIIINHLMYMRCFLWGKKEILDILFKKFYGT